MFIDILVLMLSLGILNGRIDIIYCKGFHKSSKGVFKPFNNFGVKPSHFVLLILYSLYYVLETNNDLPNW